MKYGQRTDRLARLISSIGLITIFLLLGFCPLRNMLCRLASPEPVRRSVPAPDYAKITSGKECAPAATARTVPSTQGFSGHAVATSPVFHFALVHGSGRRLALPVLQPFHTAFFPIYLRNRAILI